MRFKYCLAVHACLSSSIALCQRSPKIRGLITTSRSLCFHSLARRTKPRRWASPSLLWKWILASPTTLAATLRTVCCLLLLLNVASHRPLLSLTLQLVSSLIVPCSARSTPLSSTSAISALQGTYSCACSVPASKGTCGPTVGVEAVGPAHVAEKPRRHGAAVWEWWWYNVGQYTLGTWYSTTADGRCNDTATVTADTADTTARSATATGGVTAMAAVGAHVESPSCYWRVVSVVKRVAKTCTDRLVQAAVEAHDPACFAGCPQPHNATSTCYIGCFYTALLGRGAGVQPFNASLAMPFATVEAAFEKGFDADPDAGGCLSV